MLLFIEYPKCSTCQKGGKWLRDHSVEYTDRHILEENPTEEELKTWIAAQRTACKAVLQHQRHEVPGVGLKERLPEMSEEEQIALLATDGMLVKRPLLVGDGFVIPDLRKKTGRRLWESPCEPPREPA